MNDLPLDVFDGLFTEEEFNIYNNVLPTSVDVESLTKTGHINITSDERDGVVTETYDYVSFDGKTSFRKIHSFHKSTRAYQEIKRINQQIAKFSAEDSVDGYKRCAELVKRKNKLLKDKA